jgi:predicted secreted protein
MTIVHGKDVNIYVQVGSDWKLVACGTDCTISESAELIEVRQNTSRSRSYVAGYTDMAITASNVATIDELPKYQYNDFSVGSTLDIKIEMFNSLGDEIEIECSVIVTGRELTGNAADVATYDITMQRTGDSTETLIGNWLTDQDGNPVTDQDGYPIR